MYDGEAHLQSLWKQKPQAWGPFSTVQKILFNNLTRVGLPLPEVATPFWEAIGTTAYNYGSSGTHSTVNLTYAQWVHNEIATAGFGPTNAVVNYGAASACAPSLRSKATIWVRFRLGGYSSVEKFLLYYSGTNAIQVSIDGAQDHIDTTLKLGSSAAQRHDASANGTLLWADYEGQEVDVFLTLDNGVGNMHIGGVHTHVDYAYTFSGAMDEDFLLVDVCGDSAHKSSVVYAAVFPDVLLPEHMQEVSNDAHQFWQPVERSVYKAFNILATTAHVTVTGVQAEVRSSHIIYCTTPVVGVQGVQASIADVTSVHAATGSVSVSAVDANVANPKQVQAVTPVVSVSGVQATILRTVLLQCTTPVINVQSAKASVHTGPLPDTPVERVLIIGVDDRTMVVPNENRVFTII